MSNLLAGRYQVMPDIDPETFEALKADIGKRGVVTPIDVDELGNILDGHNRFHAWQQLGKNEPPPTIVRAGLSEDEKFAFARKQNILRRHLTREQKQVLIAEQISRTPNRSDRSIATDLACDHKTVGAVRKRLREGGEFPHSDFSASSTRGREGNGTPETFTKRLLGSRKNVQENAARVAALPADLKIDIFEAGIGAGSVIVAYGDSGRYARLEPAAEAEFSRFADFLIQFGMSEECALEHKEWLIRNRWVSPDEWLGDDGKKYRKFFRTGEPSDHFRDEWTKFRMGGVR
jgi:hypothetical protein